MYSEYSPKSNRIASRRLERALTLLSRAGRQFEAASEAAINKYDRDHFLSLALGVRELCVPIFRTASRLHGDQR